MEDLLDGRWQLENWGILLMVGNTDVDRGAKIELSRDMST